MMATNRPSLLWPWTRCSLVVQSLSNPGIAGAGGAQLEYLSDDGGLAFVDSPLHVRPLAVRADRVDVVVRDTSEASR